MKSNLFLFAALILLAACSKSTNGPEYVPGPDYNVPAEFRAWTVFGPGSWWVYKNERTLVSDTTRLTHGPFYNREPCGNCPVVEYWWFYLKGPVAVMFDIQGGKDGNARLKILRNDHTEAMALTYKTLIDPEGSEAKGISYRYEYVEKIGSLFLNGRTHKDVIHTRISWLPTYYADPPYMGYDFWFARGIGLIMMRKNYASTDTTWSLTDWHTVK